MGDPFGRTSAGFSSPWRVATKGTPRARAPCSGTPGTGAACTTASTTGWWAPPPRAIRITSGSTISIGGISSMSLPALLWMSPGLLDSWFSNWIADTTPEISVLAVQKVLLGRDPARPKTSLHQETLVELVSLTRKLVRD